ncbi:hypothetical protein LA52FAK_00930 [Desulforhopalus sp. 52FAK]
MIARPARVLILSLKPCLRARLILLGLKVKLIIYILICGTHEMTWTVFNTVETFELFFSMFY